LCKCCASLAGLVLSFIACFILLVIVPLACFRGERSCQQLLLVCCPRFGVVFNTPASGNILRWMSIATGGERQFVGARDGQYHYCMVYGPSDGGTGDQMPLAACDGPCRTVPPYNNADSRARRACGPTVAGAAVYRSTQSAMQSVASSINSLHVECDDVWPVRGRAGAPRVSTKLTCSRHLTMPVGRVPR